MELKYILNCYLLSINYYLGEAVFKIKNELAISD